jgi:hypothetical protein
MSPDHQRLVSIRSMIFIRQDVQYELLSIVDILRPNWKFCRSKQGLEYGKQTYLQRLRMFQIGGNLLTQLSRVRGDNVTGQSDIG